jgi:hypothetical protein
MPQATQASSWSFASGRAAALESQMVPGDFFQHILRGPREDLYTRLADTLVGERFSHGEDLREAESTFHNFYRGMIRNLQEQSPTPRPGDLLLWRQDLRSLKNYIKRRYLEVDVSEVETRYEPEQWDRLWEDLTVDLPPIFGRVLDRARQNVQVNPEEPQLFDAAVDSAVLGELRLAARDIGSEWIDEYWERLDSVRGVEFLFRGRALGLDDETLDVLLADRSRSEMFRTLQQTPDEEWPGVLNSFMYGLDTSGMVDTDGTARTRAFVHAGDRWVMDHVRAGRFVPFGPERVFACMVGLQAEAYNMGVAVVGRANDVDAEQLSEHLRPCYV